MPDAQSFNIAGIRLALSGPESAGRAGVAALWKNLFAPGLSTNGGHPAASVRVLERRAGAAPTLVPPGGAATVMSRDGASLLTVGGVYWLNRRGVTCEIARDSLKVEVSPEFWAGTLFEQRDLFLVAMSIFLRLHGIYGFHGNGLEKDGTGILIIGDSGAGKTTLTLGLIRDGWHFLADDAIGLAAGNGRVEARALRTGFSFTPEAIERNDTGSLFRPESWPLGTGKSLRLPGEKLQEQYRPSCVPEALFFCKFGRQERTEFERITRTEALGLCLRQAVGLAIDPELTQANMDLLRDLVDQSVQFRVVTGRDVLEQPERVSAMVLSTVRQTV